MVWRLGLIYFLSFLLFTHLYSQGPSFYFRGEVYPSFVWITQKNKKVREHFREKELANILISYVIGGSKGISRESKRRHQALNLQHLWSPSGIHFCALMVWIFPFFWWLKRKSKRYYFIVSLIFWALPFLLPGYYAIKRICLLKIAHLLEQRLPFHLDFFILYLAIMFGDFLFGTYHYAPLSFAYSFLFLGILIASDKGPPLFLGLNFLGGQLLANFFSAKSLTLTGFIWGQILTTLFSFFFPFYFLGYWFSGWIPYSWVEWTCHLYQKWLALAADFAWRTGTYYSSLNLLLAMGLIMIPLRLRKKLILLALLLLFHSDPCSEQTIQRKFHNHKWNRVLDAHLVRKAKGPEVLLK
jgi:hypothetical protein